MKPDPAIHSFRHRDKSALGKTEQLLTGLRHPAGELLVLNYHGTPKKFMPAFRAQLDDFSRRYRFLKPSELDGYFSGTLTSDQPLLLITFDDGLQNNLYAVEALAEKNITAFFFVIPGFIDTPADQQNDFFIRNIRPVINTAIDSEPEDFRAMRWDELKQLAAAGHEIGSHTLTHTLTGASGDHEKSIAEIVRSRAIISEKTGLAIRTFCSPNDTLFSVGVPEMKLIRENYRYHFTTYPGTNMDRQALFIKRVNVESSWLPGAVLRATGNWDRKRWAEKRNRFSEILQRAST